MLSHFLRTVAADDDPNFRNVTLLLPGNGTNGAQNNTFVDSSTNNFTITRNGNTTQGTFTPYGPNWSNYFAGSGNYLSIAYNVALALGTGDFTFETWVWANTATLNQNQFSLICAGRQDLSASGGGWNIHLFDDAAPSVRLEKCLTNGTAVSFSWTIAASGGLPKNSWNHVAIVRSSGTTTAYWNGVSLGSTAVFNGVDLPIPGSRAIVIASGATPTNQNFWTFSGYLSNMRIVKGSAVYTSAFTPPIAPLTAITNTSLLTCQSNRFIDTSSNNFTISVVGTPSIQRFSPFNPTGPYENTVIGGSGYFDGSGDYLATPTSAAFAWGTGDYTIEGWINPSTIAAQQTLVELRIATTFANVIVIEAGGGITCYNRFTGIVGGGSAPVGQWTHFAVTRSSGSMRLFVNGILVSGPVTDTYNFNVNTSVRIGANLSAAALYTGYISNLRLVKGTAVYTTNFTPPTAPVTAITNTSLLLNYTNAGIIDNSMMNDLETVGNAQISTAQSRFGGSSISFDGTGDYLISNAATTDLYAFGAGNFTVEFWLYLNTAQVSIIYDTRPVNTNGAYVTIYLNTNSTLTYYANTADRIVGSALANSTWYHVAVCRSGTSTRMFLNGVQTGSTYTDSTNYLNVAGRPFIGTSGFSPNTANLNGYIDDLRVTRGIARYTANFTPPVRPFPTR